MYLKLECGDAYNCNIMQYLIAHCYAECEDVTVRGRFLRLSIRLSLSDVYVRFSRILEYLDNNFTAE